MAITITTTTPVDNTPVGGGNSFDITQLALMQSVDSSYVCTAYMFETADPTIKDLDLLKIAAGTGVVGEEIAHVTLNLDKPEPPSPYNVHSDGGFSKKVGASAAMRKAAKEGFTGKGMKEYNMWKAQQQKALGPPENPSKAVSWLSPMEAKKQKYLKMKKVKFDPMEEPAEISAGGFSAMTAAKGTSSGFKFYSARGPREEPAEISAGGFSAMAAAKGTSNGFSYDSGDRGPMEEPAEISAGGFSKGFVGKHSKKTIQLSDPFGTLDPLEEPAEISAGGFSAMAALKGTSNGPSYD